MGINTTTSMTCSACGLYLMIHIILTCLCDVEVSLCVILILSSIFGRYELASAESCFRQGDLGLSLKKYLAVEKHYADITEDQFDFHSYCLRKMTLRTYVEMLQFQDRLHSHAYFRKAAAGAIR
jgi:peptide alpha-N-acetyltransferase